MKEIIAKLIFGISKRVAISAHGAASNWNTYQPKEPAALKKLQNKKKTKQQENISLLFCFYQY